MFSRLFSGRSAAGPPAGTSLVKTEERSVNDVFSVWVKAHNRHAILHAVDTDRKIRLSRNAPSLRAAELRILSAPLLRRWKFVRNLLVVFIIRVINDPPHIVFLNQLG
jgi:hypothetical protein